MALEATSTVDQDMTAQEIAEIRSDPNMKRIVCPPVGYFMPLQWMKWIETNKDQ